MITDFSFDNLALQITICYAAFSLLTFALYYLDKSAARAGARRISERTLHIFSLLGGWPGALAGQKLFRHKTRKQPFRLIFWCTVSGNLAAVLWLFLGDSSKLNAWIQSIL